MALKIITFILIINILSIFSPSDLFSQQNSLNTNYIPKVYFECSFCDTALIKNEIQFVENVDIDNNYDIKIKGTSKNENDLKYLELDVEIRNPVYGKSFTVKSAVSVYTTDSAFAYSGLNFIKLILVGIVSKTQMIKDFSVNLKLSDEKTEVTDKWNNWVFNIGGNVYLSKEASYSYSNFGSNFSIKKITEKWKIQNIFNTNYSKEEYSSNDYSAVSENRSYVFNHLLVRSVSEHFSIGEALNFTKSTYSNLDASISISPAIEFNVFKYSESTKKQLTVLYNCGYKFQDYIDTTVYEKTSQHLFGQNLNFNIMFNEDWGTISTSIGASNYFHDFSLNSIYINTYLSIRITKSLSLYISGGASLIHNQLNLVKGDASTEDILLRQRELETNYRYWTNFGINFTFGSKKNSIVNPRFNEIW